MLDSENAWLMFSKFLENDTPIPNKAVSGYSYGGWMVNIEELSFYADENTCRIFDISIDNETTKPLYVFFDFVHPDDRDRVESMLKKSFESGDDLVVNYRIRTIKGEEKSIIALGRNKFDQESKLVSMLGIVIEISKKE